MMMKVGQIVRVVSLSDNGGEGNVDKEDRQIEKYVGKVGVVKAIVTKDEHWPCGESETDPLIRLRFRNLPPYCF
mgnify:CR=1 FL=1